MQLFLTMEDKLYEGNCMLIKVIKKQTIFLLNKERASTDIYITSSGSAGELYNECSHI